MQVVSRQYPLQHYHWGASCEAWSLVDEPNMSVKLETMPPGTSEEIHHHAQAQQFFYILEGEAEFEVETKKYKVTEKEGFHIRPGLSHRIMNSSPRPLSFILFSQPSTAGDRFNSK